MNTFLVAMVLGCMNVSGFGNLITFLLGYFGCFLIEWIRFLWASQGRNLHTQPSYFHMWEVLEKAEKLFSTEYQDGFKVVKWDAAQSRASPLQGRSRDGLSASKHSPVNLMWLSYWVWLPTHPKLKLRLRHLRMLLSGQNVSDLLNYQCF